ncbi:MAG TPA: fluoride efflux transporter CrcB [Solirubrobacteraceae bacterium]|nr:fluoride efflux transporter CrcB [Solirubrobacteraceae bacterium]
MSFLGLWLGVGLIGGACSIARFLVHGLFPLDSRAGFPLGTLAVNLSGSFVLGLLVGAALHGDAYLLAGTAAVGSYTTFSTWMLDTERLARDGRLARAAVNVAASLALGIVAAELGRRIAGG